MNRKHNVSVELKDDDEYDIRDRQKTDLVSNWKNRKLIDLDSLNNQNQLNILNYGSRNMKKK